MVLVVIATASLLSWAVTVMNIPQMMADFVYSITDSPAVFLVIVNVLLVIAGMFLDAGSAIMILSPVLLPIALSLQIDPLAFGIIMVVNLSIGVLTPPVGLNLYVVSSLSNLDIYVTRSNSRMLSSDILTEFRGRSDEIRVHPLSFAEYYSAVGGDKEDAFENYAFYGGMPLILSRPTDAAKMQYLSSLFSEVYLKDIVERKKVKREDVLSDILDLLCSSVGSLTNPTRVADTINSKQKRSGENTVSPNTVKAYMDHLADAFLFTECKRWDVKGKNYFDYPNKYYCEDIGLRNARIGFRQQEMTHIMENIIFNELMVRECAVDIGIVYSNERNAKGKLTPVAREIDFIAASGGKKTYIQSAYALGTEEKSVTENKPLSLTGDSFPKIIVRHDIRKRWYDDNGVLNIGVLDFLLDDTLV